MGSSPASANVLDFLAAADVYVAPSREDSFNLPALAAMACGLPVIVGKDAGVSEWIHDGLDGVVLQDAENPEELAGVIRKLVTEPESMQRMGMARCIPRQRFPGIVTPTQYTACCKAPAREMTEPDEAAGFRSEKDA